MIKMKRVYDPWEASDGYRVLVDALWPRGITKEKARLGEWLKGIAPSTALRQWYHANPDQWIAFCDRYQQELYAPEKLAEFNRLKALAAEKKVLTLLFGSRELERNNAAVLVGLLNGKRT